MTVVQAQTRAAHMAIHATRHGYAFIAGPWGQLRITADKKADQIRYHLNSVPVTSARAVQVAADITAALA